MFDSLYVLSVASPDDLSARTAHFVRWLERLDDGVHFVMSHPGIESSELRAVCDPADDNAQWAQTWRVAQSCRVY